MPRRAGTALVLATTLVLSSCSSVVEAVDDVVGEDDPSPPTTAVTDLLLDPGQVPVGEDFTSLAKEDLVPATADHPGDDADIDPEECRSAGDVMHVEDSQTRRAGLSGTSSDPDVLINLAVVGGGRSIKKIRQGREDCAHFEVEFTTDSSTYRFTHEEDLTDGPEIEGADESFVFDNVWEGSGSGEQTEEHTPRYGVIAETRGVLVLAVTNPAGHEESGTYDPISDRVKADVHQLVGAQASRIANAS